MFCRHCGKQIDDSSKFCPYCSRQINKSDIPKAEAIKKPTGEKVRSFDIVMPKTLKEWIPVLIIVFILLLLLAKSLSAPTEPRSVSPQPQTQQKYPSFTEETMDKDCILSCAGGDWVVLWDKPTSSAEGARLHDKVPCGTKCFAFNKYDNPKFELDFYAIQTYDPRVESAWGWVTEDLITWAE